MKLVKVGPTFSSFNAVPAKITNLFDIQHRIDLKQPYPQTYHFKNKHTVCQTQLIDKPIIDSDRYQSPINFDFQNRSIEMDKEKKLTLINIDDDFFIDYYRFLSTLLIDDNR